MTPPLRATVWNEHVSERIHEDARAIYPDGIHAVIAAGLEAELGDGVRVRTATLEMPEHGLTDGVLADTDVLLWWGHIVHRDVDDEVVERVRSRVLEGMGLVVLHSAHMSKIFTRLMGTSCTLHWRHDDRETVWCVDPTHPIAEGVAPAFVIPEQEMYGEFFDIPAPDRLVFISNFAGGEVFRSGCCFSRGKGRVFYFGPGHETNPVYHQPEVRRILANAVRWAHQPEVSSAVVGKAPESPLGWFAS